MPGNYPKRPAIATMICGYEILLLVFPFGIVAFSVINALSHNFPVDVPPLPWNLWLNCAITLAAVVTLWQMRPIAVYFFAAKLAMSCWGAVELFLFLHKHGTPQILALRGAPILPATSLSLSAAPAVRVVYVILAAAIVWFVYVITRPAKVSPASSA